MSDWLDFLKDCDRTVEEDGMTFYGFDNKDGTTDWYLKDGGMDCTTRTPEDD